MPWNQRYWDNLNQFYWTPKYVGMASIPEDELTRADGMISLPNHFLPPGERLYRRTEGYDELHKRLHNNEEILNQVFDLAVGIAPDSLLGTLFLEPLGFSTSQELMQIGREIRARYGWPDNDNSIQQDGFFVSADTAVAIEIKLRAKSDPDQLLKYAALIAWEERLYGRRDQIGLLFIVPRKDIPKHWQHCGLTTNSISAAFADRPRDELPKLARELIDIDRSALESVLDRLQLQVISWQDLRDRLLVVQAGLDRTHAGDATLFRLIEGFLNQLGVHCWTGLNEDK